MFVYLIVSIIDPLSRQIDQRWVCFRKAKGHINDSWNDRADALAGQGRDVQAKKVGVQLAFEAVIGKKEQFFGFEWFSLSSLASPKDIWPELLQRCSTGIGQPEQYAKWHNCKWLDGPMSQGEVYEIITRTTPGYTGPMETRSQRRESVSWSRTLRPIKRTKGRQEANPTR
jgi:hypothetical protein